MNRGLTKVDALDSSSAAVVKLPYDVEVVCFSSILSALRLLLL